MHITMLNVHVLGRGSHLDLDSLHHKNVIKKNAIMERALKRGYNFYWCLTSNEILKVKWFFIWNKVGVIFTSLSYRNKCWVKHDWNWAWQKRVKSHSLKLDRKKDIVLPKWRKYREWEREWKRERGDPKSSSKMKENEGKRERGKIKYWKRHTKRKPYKVKIIYLFIWSPLIRRHLFNHLQWSVFQSSYNTIQDIIKWRSYSII